MYQGAISTDDTSPGEEWSRLHEMCWADLVTKLSAMQDLRTELASRASHAHSHGRFVSLAETALGNGNHVINHTHSMDGKDHAVTGHEDSDSTFPGGGREDR